MEQHEKIAKVEQHRDQLLSRQNRLLNELSLVERQLDDVIHILGRMGYSKCNSLTSRTRRHCTSYEGAKPDG